MGPENEALKMNSPSNVLQKGIKVYLRFCNVKRDCLGKMSSFYCLYKNLPLNLYGL